MRRYQTLTALFLLVTSVACNQTTSPPPAQTAAAPAAKPQPAPPEARHHHPIATANAEAQRAFDRGFELVFAFNHEEATRAFQRAAQLDPKSPMPHWGIAWSVGPNYNLDIDDPRAKQAWDAIAKAKALSADAPANERDYVDAMAIRYSSDPKADRARLARQYSQAMGDLVRRYPDDLDAATLYGESLMNLRPWKLWTLDGTPAPDTEKIVALFESVLARNPEHIGANHYYIHTVEASGAPARALASAKRLESLVPTAGHLVHMPAHIYARTGDHAGAAKANLAGAAADEVYLKTAPPQSFYEMAYYAHNLHFLADSHMMQGRFADAQQAARQLADRLTPHTAMMPMAESMVVAPLNVLLRFNKDAEAIAAPKPAADKPVMTAWWHFTRGVAFARSGRMDEAARERASLGPATAAVPETALFGGTGLESARTVLGVAGSVLDARIAWARGSKDESIAAWTRAVSAADKLPYDEPPVWFYPLRESLGAALLLSGKAADAERVFREDLQKHPRNPRSLLGLLESLVTQGKTPDAAWVKRAFDDAWKNADSTIAVEGL